MTQVFVTRTGAKYHAVYNCSGILDAEERNGHAIERWPTPLKYLHQEPCAICWPKTGTWDAWTQLEHRVEQAGGAEYERVFVRQVLRHVRDLRAFDVSVQRDAEGHSGKRYRLDFAIQGEGDRRVAVEIDGKDKAPGERSPDEIRRNVETRRADLLAAGWQVVNLSNERVANRSGECVAELESALREALRPAFREQVVDAVPVPTERRPEKSVPAPRSPEVAPAGSRHRPSRRLLLAAAAAVVVGLGTWAVVGSHEVEGPQRPNGFDCPSSAPVKGNLSEEGDKIFHQPGWRYYDRTAPEECFASAPEAEAAGYRPSAIR